MSNRSQLRLVILRVLVVSVLATLLGRLWYLQVYSGAAYVQAATANRVRDVVTPATRGQIYDSSGRPLVENRTAMVVSVNRSLLHRQRDGGLAVLTRLSAVVGQSVAQIQRTITPCGQRLPDGSLAQSPHCWNGSPYQPVPVKTYNPDVAAQLAPVLAIEEHRELFPAVTAQLEPVRFYPNGSLAAHLLGYLGPIQDSERKVAAYAHALPTAKVGRSGVEQTYDLALRGTDGVQRLVVDKDGNVTGVAGSTAPQPGSNLVLSIDARVQQLATTALQQGIMAARQTPDPVRGGTYKAPTGAVVVMEAKTGRIAAMASYPSYDPSIFTKPVLTQAEYRALTDPNNGAPLYSNATQGQFAPGSTFKLMSTSAAVAAGNSLYGMYSCPPQYQIGNQVFHNYEGETYGTIDFRTALIKSCDTVYYGLAYQQWLADGGLANTGHAKEIFARTAQGFGFGAPTGIDLPSDGAGSIVTRASKMADWRKHRADYCAGAQRRPPGSFLQRLDQENCVDGGTYRAGDAALFAIGQGDVTVTPLQLASAYAALANGGTLYAPRVAKALLSPDGRTVIAIPPAPRAKVPASPQVLDYIRSAMAGVTQPGGTASGAYAGFPQNVLPVGGKTGTADVQGKAPTAWFASFAPATNPRYVVVAMIAEGGIGGQTAAPITRAIYDGLYGLEGHQAVLPGGALPTALPVVRADGTVAPPGTKTGLPAPRVVQQPPARLPPLAGRP